MLTGSQRFRESQQQELDSSRVFDNAKLRALAEFDFVFADGDIKIAEKVVP